MISNAMIEVAVRFTVARDLAPPINVLHEALRSLRYITFDAATTELAEHYASLIIDALADHADGCID